MAPRESIIIHDTELDKPYMFPLMGRNSARNESDKEGIGFSKKRMPICNGLDRGSNFASIRKDADLLMVFSCVNRNKPTNIRYSKTPIVGAYRQLC